MVYLSTYKTGREGAKDTNSTLTTQPYKEAVMADQKVLNFDKEEKEVWKDIPGYEGYYQASSRGGIRSLKRTKKVTTRNAHSSFTYERTYGGKVLSQPKTHGYKYVRICIENVPKSKRAHILIAKAFIPNPKNKPCINHINGIKDDNRVENLEWVTWKENEIHSREVLGKVNTHLTGENNPISKLTECDVREIREIYDSEDITQQEIADKYNVSRRTIGDVVNNNLWTHV